VRGDVRYQLKELKIKVLILLIDATSMLVKHKNRAV